VLTRQKDVAMSRREPKASAGRRWVLTRQKGVAMSRREPKASAGRRWGWGPNAK
jgi:hypothetical protein